MNAFLPVVQRGHSGEARGQRHDRLTGARHRHRGALDSRRPSPVQTESPCPQTSAPPLTLIVTAWSDDGAPVMSHSALLPFTRLALRTAPWVAVTASSRSVR